MLTKFCIVAIIFHQTLHTTKAQFDDNSCEHYYSYKCYACKVDIECSCDDTTGENITLPCVAQSPFPQKYLQLINASNPTSVVLRCPAVKTVEIKSRDVNGIQNLCRCSPWNATVNQCPGPHDYNLPRTECPAPPTTPPPVTCPTVPTTTTTSPPPAPVCHCNCTFNVTQPAPVTTPPPPSTTTAKPVLCSTTTTAAPIKPLVCPPCLNISDAERMFQTLNASVISSAASWTAAPPPTKNPDVESSKLFLLLVVVILLMIFSVSLQLLIIFRKPKQPEKTQNDNTINMLSVFGQGRSSLGDDDNDDRF